MSHTKAADKTHHRHVIHNNAVPENKPTSLSCHKSQMNFSIHHNDGMIDMKSDNNFGMKFVQCPLTSMMRTFELVPGDGENVYRIAEFDKIDRKQLLFIVTGICDICKKGR